MRKKPVFYLNLVYVTLLIQKFLNTMYPLRNAKLSTSGSQAAICGGFTIQFKPLGMLTSILVIRLPLILEVHVACFA